MIETWTETGLLSHFVDLHERMPDRAFAFILGSGASRASGIPTGGELVARWLSELKQRRSADARPLEAWATAEELGVPGFVFGQAARFYSQVFVERFGADPEEGYAFLESIMEGREPSFGYSVLAQVLSETRHRVVITTNFDNLVADAISLFTGRQALVCGHELLAAFVRTRLRRPLIAKIHRDLLLEPLNRPDSIAVLQPGWSEALRRLLGYYTPLVIGYGGNDGSLMDLLRGLAPGDIAGRMYWCYRAGDGDPAEAICDVVARHRGVLVPICGFDEFFLQLGERLGLPLLDATLEQQARRRAERYREAVARLADELARQRGGAHAPLLASLRSQAERLPSALGRLLLAKSLTVDDPERAEAIYAELVNAHPEDAVALESFGLFLARRGELAKAIAMLERASRLSPDNEVIQKTLDALATGRSGG